jgi:hypothetical protein
MQSPNNVVFTSAHVIFKENLFPRCPDSKRGSKRLPISPPNDKSNTENNHSPTFFDSDDEDNSSPTRKHNNPPERRPDSPHDDTGNQHPLTTPPGTPGPQDPPPAPRKPGRPAGSKNHPKAPPAGEPRRSKRNQKPASGPPGNVYGDNRNPVDIERQEGQDHTQWQRIVGDNECWNKLPNTLPVQPEIQVPGPTSTENSPDHSDT